jgi:leukotriene-A4 hydrolase
LSRVDPHSFADEAQPRQQHLRWTARVDFAARRLACTAELRFDRGGTDVDLDTRGLDVQAVETPAGTALPFTLGPTDAILGTRLRISLPADGTRCLVRYRTGLDATALQWLNVEQTASARAPFLYSQCQAVHARSVVPLQDTPRFRLTYEAALAAPSDVRALMAARSTGRTESGGEATESWTMEKPIPSYLFAFAVGALASHELGPRSRVWAEPALVEKAAWEFAEVDRMLTQAETLLGPYVWGRFDVLVLPPSFPYGGMENPTLTFLTPTVLAGDRSLVNVLAHELAHSWTGNLVSNATAEDFWLNEGFTVFVERRLLAVLEGPESVALHSAMGRQTLADAVAGFRDRPGLTRLRTHLAGVDPDDAYSQVPYEKGFLFLRALEAAVGSAPFDAFLRSYLGRFAFQSLTTAEFLDFLRLELPEAWARVDIARWVDGEGIPADAPAPESLRLQALHALGTQLPDVAQARGWRPLEWQVYLARLARPTPRATVEALDAAFHLTLAKNPDVLVAWLVPALSSGYAPAQARAEAFLGEVGRMKYLKPVYAALLARDDTKELAEACFQRFRSRYHAIAAAGVEHLFRRRAAQLAKG